MGSRCPAVPLIEGLGLCCTPGTQMTLSSADLDIHSRQCDMRVKVAEPPS